MELQQYPYPYLYLKKKSGEKICVLFFKIIINLTSFTCTFRKFVFFWKEAKKRKSDLHNKSYFLSSAIIH